MVEVLHIPGKLCRRDQPRSASSEYVPWALCDPR